MVNCFCREFKAFVQTKKKIYGPKLDLKKIEANLLIRQRMTEVKALMNIRINLIRKRKIKYLKAFKITNYFPKC